MIQMTLLLRMQPLGKKVTAKELMKSFILIRRGEMTNGGLMMNMTLDRQRKLLGGSLRSGKSLTNPNLSR